MTAQNKTTIKSYFETNDIPTESQFADLVDSYQDANSKLSAIAALSAAVDTMPYFTGSETTAVTSITSAGRAILDDADASAQRTTLLAVGSVIAGVTGADVVTNIISLTQAEYDAIGAPNASTFYIITDA